MTGAVRRRRRKPVEKITISGTAACVSLDLAAGVAKNRGLDAYAGQCAARDQFWGGFGIYGTVLRLNVAGHDMTRGRTMRKDVNAKNRGFASMDAEKGVEAFPMKSAVFRKTANSLRKPAAKAATRSTPIGTQGKSRTHPLIPSNFN